MPSVDLDLRHLRRLMVTAEAGNMDEAAAALGLPSAALSAQIGRIESDLGEPVFDRAAGVLVPTPRGREVIELVRGVFADMAGLVAEATGDGTPTLRVAGPGFLLGPVAARFAAARPEVVVTTRSMDAHVAQRALLAGNIDAAVVLRWPGTSWPRDASGEIRSHEAGSAPLQVLLPDTHPSAAAGLVDLAELARDKWCVDADAAIGGAAITECVRHGFDPDVRYRLDGDDAVEEMVAAGQAVALVAHLPSARPGAVLRPYRDAALSGLGLLWRAEAVPAEIATDLVGALTEWQASRSWAPPPDVDGSAPGSAVRPLLIGSVVHLAVVPAVPRLRTVHGLYAEIRFGSQHDLLAALDRGELDLALCFTLGTGPDPLPPSWPRRTVVEDEQIVVAHTAVHPLAGRPLTPSGIAGAAWAVRGASGETELLRALGDAAGFVPRIASTYADLHEIAAAIGAGRVIRLADPLESAPGHLIRPVEHPAARRSLVLLWRPGSGAEPVADVVAEELRTARIPYVTDMERWTAPEG